jgi:hypothetical protein
MPILLYCNCETVLKFDDRDACFSKRTSIDIQKLKNLRHRPAGTIREGESDQTLDRAVMVKQ